MPRGRRFLASGIEQASDGAVPKKLQTFRQAQKPRLHMENPEQLLAQKIDCHADGGRQHGQAKISREEEQDAVLRQEGKTPAHRIPKQGLQVNRVDGEGKGTEFGNNSLQKGIAHADSPEDRK